MALPGRKLRRPLSFAAAVRERRLRLALARSPPSAVRAVRRTNDMDFPRRHYASWTGLRPFRDADVLDLLWSGLIWLNAEGTVRRSAKHQPRNFRGKQIPNPKLQTPKKSTRRMT